MVRHPRDSAAPPKPRQDKKPASADKLKRLSASKPGTGSGVGDKGGIRIAKAMARAGVASRREVERLIGLGKVAVNGRILDSAATLVRPDDILTLDGQVVGGPEPTRVWRYHKPAGLLTTHSDPGGRPTVFQHLPEGMPRVISVGRLDFNTEGLLILTNDGELARALELPSTGWVRRYRARAHGSTTQARLDGLQHGVEVDGVRYGPIEARLDKAQGSNVWITVSVAEGKNREVRKVLESLGLKVNRLIRLSYGPFSLGALGAEEVEEVGPRVIREQLAEFIAPENLPKGDKVSTPLPKNTRRLASAPRRPREGLADPTRKASRIRADGAVEAEREVAAESRPARRAGLERGVADRAPRAVGARGGRLLGADEARHRPSRDGGRPIKPRAPRSGPREDRAEGERAFKPRASRADPREDRPRRGGAEERPFRPRAGGAGPRTRSGEGDSRPSGPRGAGPDRKGPPRGAGPSRGPRREPGEGRPFAPTTPRADRPRSGPPRGAKPGGPKGAPRSGPPRGGKPGGPGRGGPKRP
jgi:23S rRNA pseudouridine2605 synthase